MTTQHFEYPQDVIQAREQQKMPEIQTSVEQERPSTGRPKPQVSEALQQEIARRLQEAELPQVTSEYVKPEGATEEIKPTKYTPTKAVDMVSVDLPSRFAFYDFEDLLIGKFKTRHYAKLHEAHITHSLEYLLECVSDVIGTTSEKYQNVPLAFHLTIPDFYWVLYFLRLNQIKTSLTHQTRCQNPEHIMQVESGQKPEESLKIIATVDRTQIHTRMLDALPDMEEFKFEKFELRPPLMMDVVTSLNYPEFMTSSDIRYLCRVASLVTLKDDPNASLAERIAIIDDDLEYSDLAKIGKYEQMVTGYGPDEFINVTCKECGHQRRTKVQLDARSFLPFQ